MSTIILDFGSGNTCNNDIRLVKDMIDSLNVIDSGKHKVIIKWQLFVKAGENVPLKYTTFKFAYDYAKRLGYETTASVFDVESLNYLLMFDVPFIKIANNESVKYLTKLIPKDIEVISSVSDVNDIDVNTTPMLCVSKYPATLEDYESSFKKRALQVFTISDHTCDFELFNKYKPKTIEWHYKLNSSRGLDAGEFARTPEELSEIL